MILMLQGHTDNIQLFREINLVYRMQNYKNTKLNKISGAFDLVSHVIRKHYCWKCPRQIWEIS